MHRVDRCSYMAYCREIADFHSHQFTEENTLRDNDMSVNVIARSFSADRTATIWHDIVVCLSVRL